MYTLLMPSERSVVAAVEKVLKARGAWFVKTCPPIRSGTPDLLVCYLGEFIALEVKNEVGRVSKIQEYEMERIRRAGGDAVVVRSAKDAEVLLEAVACYHR